MIRSQPGGVSWILHIFCCSLTASSVVILLYTCHDTNTQVLMNDEEGIAADRALRRVLEGDSDCGSVYESVTGRGAQNAAVGGEKAQAAKAQTEIQTPRMEPPQADAQQSLGGDATEHDRPPAVREASSAKRFTKSLGDRRSSGGESSAWGSSPESFGGLSVSVRAKIEMFERTVRSVTAEEPKLKVATGRASRPSLGRSLSEKVRAHESAISAAAKTSKGLPVAFTRGTLGRSQSYQLSSRASPLPTVTATTERARDR